MNEYHWIRGQNHYDSWYDSGVSGNAVRSFYDPPKSKACRDCHLPLVPSQEFGNQAGMLHDHVFPAANTALPAIRGDKQTIEDIQKKVLVGSLSIDIFGLKSGCEVVPFGPSLPSVRPGETLDVEVVVRTRTLGHPYTNGTADSNESWVEFRADNGPRSLMASGTLDTSGPSRPGRRQALAARNRARRLGDGPPAAAGHPRSALQQLHPARRRADRPLPVQGPRGREGLRHALGRRELPQVYEGLFDLRRRTERSGAPDHAHLGGLRDAAGRTRARRDARERRQARQPRLARATVDPLERLRHRPPPAGRPEGRFDRVQEGRRARGRQAGRPPEPRPLQGSGGRPPRREGRARGRPRSGGRAGARRRYFRSLVSKEEGRLDDALADLDRVLAKFPKDRVVLNQKARVLYLAGKYAEALPPIDAVLAIDGEDLAAHYNAMLCLKALGRSEEAAAEEKWYRFFKDDESARATLADYRIAHPHDNRESLPVHVHDDAQPAQAVPPAWLADIGSKGYEYKGYAPKGEMVLKDDRPRGAPRPFARPEPPSKQAGEKKKGPGVPVAFAAPFASSR